MKSECVSADNRFFFTKWEENGEFRQAEGWPELVKRMEFCFRASFSYDFESFILLFFFFNSE